MLGVVIAACRVLFARPRLRIGPSGLAVRNLFGYRLFPWTEVVDVSFPPGARWARLDLPDDEYVPVMAIQAVDKGRAVDAMDQVRALPAALQEPVGASIRVTHDHAFAAGVGSADPARGASARWPTARWTDRRSPPHDRVRAGRCTSGS